MDLRDTFKLIDYLVAPTVGVGDKLVDTPIMKFSAGGGVGAIWETRISEQLQLAVDVLDTFKNQPPTPTTRKNDVAVVTAMSAKF
ncbi:MAG: DUF481 domain-containing protein [Vicinamibacterales bacterium]